MDNEKIIHHPKIEGTIVINPPKLNRHEALEAILEYMSPRELLDNVVNYFSDDAMMPCLESIANDWSLPIEQLTGLKEDD